MLHAGFGGALQEIPGRAGVVAVVLERVAHGLRHDGVRGEVHDRIDAVLGQHPRDQRTVAGVADDEFTVRDCLGEARAQVVERHHALPGLAELANDMTPDVAGAARDENAVRHPYVSV